MVKGNSITLEEGCNKYLDNCRARNLREVTINHYRQSYVQFYKYFGKDLLVRDIPVIFYRHYPSYINGELNVSELARVCDMSRTTVYHYINILKT